MCNQYLKEIGFLLIPFIIILGCTGQNTDKQIVFDNKVEEVTENPFEPEIQAFEKLDTENPPEDNLSLFVGSSSIRMWNSLSSDFPENKVINRGFGGSETSDVIYFFERIITPYKPEKIFFYEGDNDIANGKSPEQVFQDFEIFLDLIKESLPGTPVAFISIMPSPSRWDVKDEIVQANQMIKELSQRRQNLEFIDVFYPMLGDDGRPNPEFYIADSLHMTPAGYEVWKEKIGAYLLK